MNAVIHQLAHSLFCGSITAFLFLGAGSLGSESEISSKIKKTRDAYADATDAAARAYRRAFSDAIAGATTVEVYLLDFEMTRAEGAPGDSAWPISLADDLFPIVPYGTASKILKRKKLSADEIRLLMPSLQATIAVEKPDCGALCHFPIHGLRIWHGDDIIFQTSICYQCSNFYMSYPFGGASWTSLSEPKFRQFMEQLMPIPQTESDRFNAKYGGKKKPSKRKKMRD